MTTKATNRPYYWAGYKAGREGLTYDPPEPQDDYDGSEWPAVEYNDGFGDGQEAREDNQDEQNNPRYKNLPPMPNLDDYDAEEDEDDSGQYLHSEGYCRPIEMYDVETNW